MNLFADSCTCAVRTAKKRFAPVNACALTLLLSWGAIGHAVAQDTAGANVLRGKEVTEENLLKALTPTDKIISRSLRVRPSGSGVLAPTLAAKPSTSLLITFETNSFELTAAAKQQLDIVGAALKNARLADYNFNLEGHADPRGNAETNMTLSMQRAESVRAYLVSTHGIGPQRLIAEGKGDLEVMNRAFPAAPENRRVRIVTNVQ